MDSEMERNDDTNNENRSIESEVINDLHSSSIQSLICCSRAALMLASLKTRSTENDDDDYRKVFFPSK